MWLDPVKNSAGLDREFDHDLFVIDKLSMKTLHRIMHRLYFDMKGLSADDMRDMAHLLSLVIDQTSNMPLIEGECEWPTSTST